MRSHRRRTPLEHVLVAGSSAELPAIGALLALLPTDAYGQVFVETEDGEDLSGLSAPPRVTVSRLTRPGDVPAGDFLCDAVRCWLEEWTPEENDPSRTLTLWIGASARDRIDAVGAPLETL